MRLVSCLKHVDHEPISNISMMICRIIPFGYQRDLYNHMAIIDVIVDINLSDTIYVDLKNEISK